MNKIKDIIMSGTEPSVKENGWLVPNKDGKLELKFFGPNGWETVSSGGASGDSNIYILPEPDGYDEGEEVTTWTAEMVERASEICSNGGAVFVKLGDMVAAYCYVDKTEDGSIYLHYICLLALPIIDYSERPIIGAQYVEQAFTYNPTTGKITADSTLSFGNSVQHYFEVDDTLYLTHAEDNTFDPDTLGIKDGGVTLAKLAPDVPIYQPPIIHLSNNPKEGDVISNWTRDVWDRVNNIKLTTLIVRGATYFVTAQNYDDVYVLNSTSGIINGTLRVESIEVAIKWNESTNQTELVYYSNQSGTAIQTPTLSTIKTLPVEEEVITEWTAADFNACRNGFENTPKTYHQVFIEGKLYTPIWVSDNEEQDDDIILGSMETTTDSLINTTLVRIRLENNSVLLIEKTSHTGAGCVTRVIDVADTQLVGFSDKPSIFEDTFGVSPDLLYYTEGTLTVRGYWFNTSQMVSLTAVSCYADDEQNWKTVFTDGTNLVTVNYDSMGNSVDITSTPVLTEGRAPTMTQFNALSAQIGDIDTVLTSIIGE